MPISASLYRRISEIDPPLRDVLFAILEEVDQQVTKAEFKELKDAVYQLCQSVKELTETQKKREERVNELAEAQKRTEERLIQFQKQTEENFNRVWKTINELAEAQKRTEKEVAKLARGLQRVRKEVGGLSRTVAYALENEAYRHLPSLLKEKLGLEVQERIVRTYIAGEEINIFARAKRNGEEVVLVGEAVLKLDDVAKLKKVWRKVEAVKEEIGGEVVPIIVTHFAKPNVLERAHKAGIIVVQSFEWI